MTKLTLYVFKDGYSIAKTYMTHSELILLIGKHGDLVRKEKL